MIDLSLTINCPSVLGKLKNFGVLNFYTDTRKFLSPGAFVAIPGAKVNPLDVLTELLQKGCQTVFYQQDKENDDKVSILKQKFSETEFIPVTDSVIFLQEISHHHIIQWKNKRENNTVFAISGSNGKTTHKEMLSYILKEVLSGKVVSTEKNNNNHLGVPLTLLNVSDYTEIVVLELGSNHPGEIKVLCEIAQPNSGLTTNIGATHLEFFGSEEKVFQEEGFLFHAVSKLTNGKGLYLINLDDPFLRTLIPFPGAITYGEHKEAQANVTYCEDGADIEYRGEIFSARNEHITGKHNKLNLVTCLFVASLFHPEKKLQFIEACKNFRPTKNRSEWIEFEEVSVYLDAYNANPSSMKAALEGFKASTLSRGFKLSEACIVLGDMNELGDSTPQYHEEIGQFVKNLGFSNVFFVGRFSSFYQRGNPEGHMKSSSADFKDEYRKECLKKFPIHFIKGSRSLQLESLFDIT